MYPDGEGESTISIIKDRIHSTTEGSCNAGSRAAMTTP